MMLLELGTAIGLGILAAGAVSISSSDARMRRSDKEVRLAVSDLMDKTLCPCCGGFNWDYMTFQGAYVSINCGNCSLHIGDQEKFLDWADGNLDLSERIEGNKFFAARVDAADLEKQMRAFRMRNKVEFLETEQ